MSEEEIRLVRKNYHVSQKNIESIDYWMVKYPELFASQSHYVRSAIMRMHNEMKALDDHRSKEVKS